MILNFEDRGYVDIDSIQGMRWFPEVDPPVGMVLINGEKIGVAEEEYEIIEKAFRYKHNMGMYDKDMKKIKGDM